MCFRNALYEKGFSFEYSAIFGQVVKGNRALTDLYAKSILFDYSYRYFYGDGFGKDYQILNLDDQAQQKHLESYLVACLLAFFQQQRLYRGEESAFRPFNIDKPLWIFVGASVTQTLATREDLQPLLADQSWYRLLIPAEEMAFDSFEKVRLWEEIVLSLLKKYTERYYTFRKRKLQSFIVSNTPSHTMQKLWNMDKPAMAAWHILFQEEDKDIHVRSMLEAVGPAGTSTATDAAPA